MRSNQFLAFVSHIFCWFCLKSHIPFRFTNYYGCMRWTITTNIFYKFFVFSNEFRRIFSVYWTLKISKNPQQTSL